VASPTPAPEGLTIDVTKDLESTSDLKSLISQNTNIIFQLASDLAKLAGQPVSAAAGSFSVSLSLTATLPTWTAGPVMFSLAPSAKCTITIATQGEDLEAALNIADTGKTTNVQLAAAAGTTYINIDLDFSLTGNASGSGTLEGLTISGKAAGSSVTTLSFCQPVPSTTETMQALKIAFSDIVFPTSPSGALTRMTTGSSSRMTFDGSLSWELDLSYGLADYKLSASSFGLLQKSFTAAGQSLTPPSAEIKAGATASVKYSHTDHFGLIVIKPDANSARVFLVRANAKETDVNVGISVGITVTAASVTADPAQIQSAVQSVTGSSALASTVSSVVTPQLTNLESSLLSGLNSIIKEGNGDAGISVALKDKTNRVALFNYQVDLTRPVVATQSWNDLLTSNVGDATNLSGFTPLAGSGVSRQLSKSTTLQFHFFNLFSFTGSSTFFDNCTAALSADGSIQVTADVGIENLVIQNSSKVDLKVHFTATATEGGTGSLSGDSVDLDIEFSETGSAKAAVLIGSVLGLMKQPSLNPAITAMNNYSLAHPAGTLALLATLKRTAYSRLKFSAFNGGINGTPRKDQSADKVNWNAIHSAAVTLVGKTNAFITPFTFEDWEDFNSFCNTGNSGAVANRRQSGNPSAVPSTFFKGNDRNSVGLFLLATARGMNIFEDLVTLAADVQAATTNDQFKIIQNDLAAIINGDLDSSYAQPIAASILTQASAQVGAGIMVDIAQAADASTFTTTLVLT
jgi:hypothetical protein